MVTVRKVRPEEIDWVNSKYDEVPFQHSVYDREFVAVAELDGERVGLGRIISWDNENAELGGMYVFPGFQGRGVGQKIIQFLLENRPPQSTLYCIPFKPMAPLYQRFGFVPVKEGTKVSALVLKKFNWCTANYEQGNYLYVLEEGN